MPVSLKAGSSPPYARLAYLFFVGRAPARHWRVRSIVGCGAGGGFLRKRVQPDLIRPLDLGEVRRYFALYDQEDLLEALKDGR